MRKLGPLCLCLATLAPEAASAQTRPAVDVRSWRPSMDPEAGVASEPVVTPGPWRLNFAAWARYDQSPVLLRDASSGGVVARPLDHSLDLDLVAGVGLGDRAAIGVDLPLALWQDGTTGLPDSVISQGKVSTTALGDLALLGKGTLLSNDHLGVRRGFGLAALAAVSLPTGDRRSFLGEDGVSVSASLLAEFAVGVAAARASLGYRVRTDPTTWPDASAGGVPFGDEIPWSFALSLRPKALFPKVDADDRQTWELALHGALPAGPVAPFGLGDAGASALSPVLLAADDRVALGHDRDLFLLLGAEVGLDQAVGVPSFRGILELGWAPRPHDRDNDGVPDDKDECPDLPEDRDGIQDEDGCPEDDADGDGVPDTEDACPLVAGVPQDDRARNGCPEAK